MSIALVLVLSLALVSGPALAAESCESCPSKQVCSDSEKSSCASGNGKTDGKTAEAPAASPKTVSDAGTTEVAAAAASVSAIVNRGSASVIIKLKGEKSAIDVITGAFCSRFGIKNGKGADCEVTKVASDVWIKVSNGAEADKLEYLKSLGIASGAKK